MENKMVTNLQLQALKKQFKETQNQRYLEQSKERLNKIISTKMRTSFIGALDTFEKNFGHLWGYNNETKETKPRGFEEERFYELWQLVRTQVLDKGNNQLRAAQSEISNHIVSWQRYHVDFIMTPENPENPEHSANSESGGNNVK
jgi:hypothetical protein